MKKIFISTSTFAEHSTEPLLMITSHGYESVLNPYKRKLEISESKKNYQDIIGLIAGTEIINKEVLNTAKNLQVISRVGVGLDSVDVEYAKSKGIKIFTTNTDLSIAVAELAVSLIFSLLRKVPVHNAEINNGVWNKKIGNLLYGKKLGIIGLGKIGKRVVELTQGFKLEYFVVDKFKDDVFAEKYNIQYVTMNELLSISDIVTIHLSGSKENVGIINKTHLNRMKKDSIIVNTSRGGIVDETDLHEALEKKVIAGAGLDVFEKEPYAGSLRNMPNVVLTPHIGSFVKEVRGQMELEAVRNLLEGLKD